MNESFRVVCCFVGILVLVGCGDDSTPGGLVFDATVDSASPVDAGKDGAVDAASKDTGVVDSTVDSATSPDSGVADAMIPPFDAAPVPTEFGGACLEGARRPTCPDAGCRDGWKCMPGLCGGTECISMPFCQNDEDCPGDRRCVSHEDERIGKSCEVPADDACTADHDCPLGYTCRAGECQSVRLGCETVPDRCPTGYFCSYDTSEGVEGFFSSHCIPLLRSCERDSQCSNQLACLDLNNDGKKECAYRRGACQSNDECAFRSLGCGANATADASFCSPEYHCASSEDCIDGYDCIDARQIGAGICLASGGECSTHAECGAGGACVSLNLGLPTRCVGYAGENL